MSDAVSTDARTDWENRIGLRSGHAFGGSAPRLSPPGGLVAEAGGAQVTLSWSPVRPRSAIRCTSPTQQTAPGSHSTTTGAT